MINKHSNIVNRHGHTCLYKDLIDAIKEDREPLINGIEGKKSLEIVLGAYKSQRLGRKVELQFEDLDCLDYSYGV